MIHDLDFLEGNGNKIFSLFFRDWTTVEKLRKSNKEISNPINEFYRNHKNVGIFGVKYVKIKARRKGKWTRFDRKRIRGNLEPFYFYLKNNYKLSLHKQEKAIINTLLELKYIRILKGRDFISEIKDKILENLILPYFIYRIRHTTEPTKTFNFAEPLSYKKLKEQSKGLCVPLTVGSVFRVKTRHDDLIIDPRLLEECLYEYEAGKKLFMENKKLGFYLLNCFYYGHYEKAKHEVKKILNSLKKKYKGFNLEFNKAFILTLFLYEMTLYNYQKKKSLIYFEQAPILVDLATGKRYGHITSPNPVSSKPKIKIKTRILLINPLIIRLLKVYGNYLEKIYDFISLEKTLFKTSLDEVNSVTRKVKQLMQS